MSQDNIPNGRDTRSESNDGTTRVRLSDEQVHANGSDGENTLPANAGTTTDGRSKVVGESEGKENSQASSANSEYPGIVTEEQKYEVLEKYTEESLQAGNLSINSFKIKKMFPKTYARISEYMNEKVLNSGTGLDEETIMGVLMYSPRSITFNFLDDHGIFLNIYGSHAHWKYSFEAETSEESYQNRTSCEYAAYFAAFAILEKKLNLKTT